MGGLKSTITIIDEWRFKDAMWDSKNINKLTTPGRDKAIDYMCNKFNERYGDNLINRDNIKITDINYMGIHSGGDYGIYFETCMKKPESKVNIHFMNIRTNSKNLSVEVEIGFSSSVTNDKYFEATCISDNPDEWFTFY